MKLQEKVQTTFSDMVYSMTGFGMASGHFRDREIKVEIRALNSKFTDIRLRVPAIYKDYEINLRKIIQQEALRGKIDFSIESTSEEDNQTFEVSTAVLDTYVNQLKAYASDNNLDTTHLLSAILHLPNVVVSSKFKLPEGEWQKVKEITLEAFKRLREYRLEEGKATLEVLKGAIGRINASLDRIKPYEAERLQTIKNQILQNLSKHFAVESIDQNRFEQELIYYIEKFDFSEEKERLSQHTAYFIETLDDENPVKGKKLTFISQEMGREINTLGSKAQHSDIQRIVVEMKDDLEKIKEQLFNII